MKNQQNINFQYKLTKPPRVIRKARLDNIAIVPASMLPFKEAWLKVANKLPQGAVLLYHSQNNVKQTKLFERVEEIFKQQGYAVTNLAM